MQENELTIFFSWQSQLDKNKNTNLIRSSLKKAIKKIKEKRDIEITIDEATRGETGSPSITQVIQQKIPLCNIFIADVTIISDMSSPKISMPNPNVMFELGLAVAEIGWSRIICLTNDHYGHDINELPFDIRGNRISPYNSDSAGSEFINKLQEYIIAIIDSNPKTPQQLRGVSKEKIQHERDVRNISFIMSYLHTPTLGNLASGAPSVIRGDVFYCWATFSGILKSKEFYLYDEKIKEIFNSIYDHWEMILNVGQYYYETANNGFDHIFSRRNILEMKGANQAWDTIENEANILNIQLSELITYIKENYIEVDIDETNQQALQDLLNHRPDLSD